MLGESLIVSIVALENHIHPVDGTRKFCYLFCFLNHVRKGYVGCVEFRLCKFLTSNLMLTCRENVVDDTRIFDKTAEKYGAVRVRVNSQVSVVCHVW